jgi:hypothetical protein
MSGGIAVGEVAIPSSSHHAPGAYYDRSYRHLARLEGTPRTAEGFFHPKLVGGPFAGRKPAGRKPVGGKLASGRFVRGEQL